MPDKNIEYSHATLQDPGLIDTRNASFSERPRSSNRLVTRLLKKVGQFLWYSFKKTSYVAFLVLAVILLFMGLDKAAELVVGKSYLAYVYPQNLAMAKRDFTQPVSHYDYDLNPGVCLIFNQQKGNQYEYANNAGFRDPRSIPLAKPDDEFRIFLTGGSTAFGLGAAGQAAMVTNFYYIEHRETIAYALERILNSTASIPGKKIRVYNTAVWGYSYQHLLFRYVTKLRRYKPDLIVSLDGANEIGAVSSPEKEWDYFRQGQYNGILRQVFSYNRPGLWAYTTLWLKNNTFLMTCTLAGHGPICHDGSGHENAPGGSSGPRFNFHPQRLFPGRKIASAD